MYFRRHCYDKQHRCPGWAGGGWRYPRNEDRRVHWWQRKTRCKGGTLWKTSLYDPWIVWRWHRCTTCDVIAFPIAVRNLDPTWWKYVISSRVSDLWFDLKTHKEMWIDPAPWWSLPWVVWTKVRSSMWSKQYHIENWFKRLHYWYAPSRKAERAKDLAEAKAHYGVS